MIHYQLKPQVLHRPSPTPCSEVVTHSHHPSSRWLLDCLAVLLLPQGSHVVNHGMSRSVAARHHKQSEVAGDGCGRFPRIAVQALEELCERDFSGHQQSLPCGKKLSGEEVCQRCRCRWRYQRRRVLGPHTAFCRHGCGGSKYDMEPPITPRQPPLEMPIERELSLAQVTIIDSSEVKSTLSKPLPLAIVKHHPFRSRTKACGPVLDKGGAEKWCSSENGVRKVRSFGRAAANQPTKYKRPYASQHQKASVVVVVVCWPFLADGRRGIPSARFLDGSKWIQGAFVALGHFPKSPRNKCRCS
jgi:hypothetical protein